MTGRPNFYDLSLLDVSKPTRYIGSEIGSVYKDEYKIHMAMIYPDTYEIGMSYLGMHILYELFNSFDSVYCERAFMPSYDMYCQMQRCGVSPFTLETKTPLSDLDIIGFTLQYEMSYTNIIRMLLDSGIEPYSRDRENAPLIIAGGPCAFNPEPLADFFDLFVIGEAEELSAELFALAKSYDLRAAGERHAFLLQASKIEGVYVPSLFVPLYKDGDLIGYNDPSGEPAVPVTKRIVEDFDSAFSLSQPIVPYSETVHDRAVLEIFRGCTKGCRFCQAGMIYRPVRERSVETVVRSAREIIKNTGYNELSLSSLSTLDHSDIDQMTTELLADADGAGSVSLPSLRMDSDSAAVLEKLSAKKKSGLTFAPEAGSQRMRDVINKGITEENILETFTNVFGLGWFRMKLYFMIGLPTETDPDLLGIADIGDLAVRTFNEVKPASVRKGAEIGISASCFVPKPFTPFQWHGQNSIDEFWDKINFLKKRITNSRVKFTFHDPYVSWLEGVLARGDRRIAPAILSATKKGCMMDGWSEHFKFDLWMQAFEENGIDPKYYNERERSKTEFLPWDILDCGVSKDFLKREYKNAVNEKVTRDCRDGCLNCGIMNGVTDICPMIGFYG